MFKLIALEDTIRIPPGKFGEPIEEVGYEQLRMKYEGMVDEELGYVIAVTEIQVNPVGKSFQATAQPIIKLCFRFSRFFRRFKRLLKVKWLK